MVGSELANRPFQHLRHQGCDRRALAARQGYMGKERVALEGLNDCNDAIVAAHPQIIALADIVS